MGGEGLMEQKKTFTFDPASAIMHGHARWINKQPQQTHREMREKKMAVINAERRVIEVYISGHKALGLYWTLAISIIYSLAKGNCFFFYIFFYIYIDRNVVLFECLTLTYRSGNWDSCFHSTVIERA